MARFRRRNNHWLFQPRSTNGRFASSGNGGNEPNPLNDWFVKAPWWQKLAALALFGVFIAWLCVKGYIIVFIILAWILGGILKLITSFLES